MADTKSTGTPILFKMNGVPIAGESSCSFSVSGDEIEFSNKSTAQWKEFLPGRNDWTAQGASMMLFDTNDETLEASQKALFNSKGSIIEVEIALTPNLTFSGSAFLTTFDANADDNAPATFSWAVRGTDALVLNEGV